MSKALVIVESPAKAKSIGKYLGQNYVVKASVGHVLDLPPTKLGVEVEKDFQPTYVIIKGKKPVIDEIKKLAKGSDSVYLATDPDREGEAIAYHLAQAIKSAKVPVHRVLFNEITKKTVLDSIAHPQEIDENLFNAQQARRILDRLVGYKISPLLWEKVQRGLSAGRVQSVALRIVCERDTEVQSFKAEEYWSLHALLEGSIPPAFQAKLIKINQKEAKLATGPEVEDLKSKISQQNFVLKQIVKKERRRNPAPPFITSTLQQEAARKLGYSAKRTMQLAQMLYEGVELEDGEVAGLITYMRTDSTRIGAEALQSIAGYIVKQYGKEFLPETARIYKTKKAIQDAHECIRPTSMDLPPERVKDLLKKDLFRLYELIWKRTVACQMAAAIYDQTTFDIEAGPYAFRATGSILKFSGFIEIYLEGRDEANAEDEDEEGKRMPDLKEGEVLKLNDLTGEQHFTQPPSRFTEASLVKTLEELGIGRPSTYAAILSTLVDKKYCEKLENKFHPTQLGKIVNELLVGSFPEILDVKFTAQMEDKLDEIEEGKRQWVATLREFYQPFEKTLNLAKTHMKNIKKQEIATEYTCEKCGKPMVVKWGRHGEFLACVGYPDCKSTKEIKRKDDGGIAIQATITTDEVCEKCGSPMVVKRGRFGQFLACSKYPDCKSTKAISMGVACPDCGKPLSERRTKRGKPFYGCTGYPNCKFALWDKPVKDKPCPKCQAPFLLAKFSKRDGQKLVCYKKECGYEERVGEAPSS